MLLDANMIPIGMEMYPGNESEQPVFRNVIKSLKDRNNIKGRTIRIADKGLNSARNIITAINNRDGYIFSKSVKKLAKVEKTWVLLDNDYTEVKDEKIIYYSNTSHALKNTPIPILMKTEGNMSKKSGKKELLLSILNCIKKRYLK